MRWSSPQLAMLFWGLLALALLWLWGDRARRRSERELGNPETLRALTSDAGSRPRLLRAILTLAAVALAVVGLMRPQAGFRLVTTTSQGVDLVLALDLSRSMDARDVRPDRLTAAKREALALLGTLEGSRIGLVEFAGSARIVSPLSTDREGLASIVETATTRDLDQPGTDLGQALERSARLLARPGEQPRAIVLFSDGENLEGDPRRALEIVKRAGAKLYAVGLGSAAGAVIPIVDSTGATHGQKRDAQGNVVVTRLDERTLRLLAEGGGGRYERGDGTGRAGLKLADPIRSGGSFEARGRTIRAYDERYPWFAAAAGLLLLGERLVPRRRK